MNRRRTLVANRLALLLLVAPTAFAHHSTAMFDFTKTVTLEGSIERYEWANPHVYIRLASRQSQRLAFGFAKRARRAFRAFADRTTLTYRFRLEDPEYLAAPFEGSAVWEHRPGLPYKAEECILENARRYLEER